MAFRADGTLWGHPKGLFVLFLTEMWERFSYYGMRSLLVYYMVKHLMFSQSAASQIYGLYTGLVYLTPFLGGALADRVIGRRKAVIIGAIVMAAGHFMMAFESLFIGALIFLVIGNGFFKPNISTQVGELYTVGDSRRDSAFSIFYVGINLGAFFSPLICGTLGEVYGWHYGFSAAGTGMILGLIVYLFGKKWLGFDSHDGYKIFKQHSVESLPGDEKQRLWVLLAVGLVTAAFWAAYEQQGNTIALWADAYTERRVMGMQIPASWFQSLNPAFIFVLTPMVTSFWSWRSRKGKEPAAISKMAFGCFLLGLGFLVMAPAAIFYSVGGTPVGMSWLITFNLLVTLGELYLSPVGLSLVTKLSPTRMVSMIMGAWFLSSFFGNYGAGFLGQYWEKMAKENFFLMIAMIAFMACFFMLLIRVWMKRISKLNIQTY